MHIIIIAATLSYLAFNIAKIKMNIRDMAFDIGRIKKNILFCSYEYVSLVLYLNSPILSRTDQVATTLEYSKELITTIEILFKIKIMHLFFITGK